MAVLQNDAVTVITPILAIGTVAYNGLVLQLLRVEEWDHEVIRDEVDVDYCLTKVTCTVRCEWDPAATATANAGQASPPPFVPGQLVPGVTMPLNQSPTVNPPFPGDRVGVSLAAAWQLIFQDRKPLTILIGNDIVLQSPQSPLFECDADNGPRVLNFRIIQINGTKSATVIIRFSTVVGGGSPALPPTNNMVLSNRWSSEANVNEDWFTTIVTRGRMKLRTDLLYQVANPTPDIFRSVALPPILPGFRRYPIHVKQTMDNAEMEWACVDTQVALEIPVGTPNCTRIEGSITAGWAMPWKDSISFAKDLYNNKGSIFDPSAAVRWLVSRVPQTKNAFQLQAYGFPGASRSAMLRTLVSIVLDRFNLGGNFPILGVSGTCIVSLFYTSVIDKVAVQITGEMLGTFQNTVQAVLNPYEPLTRLNIASDTIQLNGEPNLLGAAGTGTVANPVPVKLMNPPNSNNTRGAFVGLLLGQALKADFDFPPNSQPSYTATNYDAQSFV